MPLVYAAFVPHSPILVPTIGKENATSYSATLESYQSIRTGLQESRADMLLLVSPHGEQRPSIQGFVSEHFTSDLKRFGDLTFNHTYKSSYLFLVKLKKRLKNFPFLLTTEHSLDYGASVPLALLRDRREDSKADSGVPIPLSPIRISQTDVVIHFQFGSHLYEEIASSEKNVAILATGDLAHSHKVSSLTERSVSFDHSLIQAIKGKDVETLLHPSGNLLPEPVDSCSLKPLAVLLGSLGEQRYTPHILSYENSLGVGLLTLEFLLG